MVDKRGFSRNVGLCFFPNGRLSLISPSRRSNCPKRPSPRESLIFDGNFDAIRFEIGECFHEIPPKVSFFTSFFDIFPHKSALAASILNWIASNIPSDHRLPRGEGRFGQFDCYDDENHETLPSWRKNPFLIPSKPCSIKYVRARHEWYADGQEIFRITQHATRRSGPRFLCCS